MDVEMRNEEDDGSKFGQTSARNGIPNGVVELFPQKVAAQSFEDGDSTTLLSLADRIQGDGDNKATVELFPDLVRKGANSRQRRRRRAEDHF